MSDRTKRYVGVTVGPVFDTVNMTSSPAALWAASFMFSALTRTVCDVLTEQGVGEERFVSPSLEAIEGVGDGIGLYHDRIVFEQGDFDIRAFSQVREEAVSRLAARFFGIDNTAAREYLMQYLLVAAASFEAVDPLKEAGPLLDSLELARPFASGFDRNPILALFTNSEPQVSDEGQAVKIGSNEAVKALMKDFKGFGLEKARNANGDVLLKSLADIAGVYRHSDLKKHRYFAVVRSDGDAIGKLIAKLDTDDDRRRFSADCLRFCGAMAKLTAAYEGVTIYAGGDDLLALLPCEAANGATPLEFVKEASELFDRHFKEGDRYPAVKDRISLSLSVTMSFYKYPLYEALQTSQEMLFTHAKSVKNGAVIYLQKHAGQSEGVFVSREAMEELIALKDRVKEQKNDLLLSALYKLELFDAVLNAATDTAMIVNTFANLFDAASHKGNAFLHKELPALFGKLQNGQAAVYALDGKGIRNKEATGNPKEDEMLALRDTAQTLCYMLRICKFFIEKEGEA